jgi:hypothetical protein
MPIDQITIGGRSANTVTVRYAIGYTREGWGDAEPESIGVDRPLHVADVTMPAMYPGTKQERDCWRRDAILDHYGMEA